MWILLLKYCGMYDGVVETTSIILGQGFIRQVVELLGYAAQSELSPTNYTMIVRLKSAETLLSINYNEPLCLRFLEQKYTGHRKAKQQ